MPPPRRRRSPGEGGVFEYTTKAGATRWGIKFLVQQPDGSKRQVLRRRGPNGETWTTLKAAQAAIREAMTKVDRQEWAEPSKLLLGVYLEQWLDGLRLAPSTLASYRKNVRLHITPYLGGVPLAQLTGPRIAKAYRAMETNGRKDHRAGEPLSARTVRYVHTILRSALRAAVEGDLIARNPCDKGAKPPKASEAKPPEMQAWTASDLRTFLGWSIGHADHTAWLVLAHTGLRRGELLALRWRDIDLDAGRAAVLRSVGVVKRKGAGEQLVEGGTKTRKPRVIDLDAVTVAALRALRRDRATLSLALLQPDHLVFCDPSGGHQHPERFSRRFARAVARCQRELGDDAPPVIRLHDLRHTHATLLLQAGTPVKVVSERLGHANAMITLTVYAHVMPGMQRQAADAFGALLGGDSGAAVARES